MKSYRIDDVIGQVKCSDHRPSSSPPLHQDKTAHRTSHVSLGKLRRRSFTGFMRTRPIVVCIFYVVSLTTDWGTWVGTGGWRATCCPSRTSHANDSAFQNTDSLLFACAIESKDTDDVNDVQSNLRPGQRNAVALQPVADAITKAEKRLTLSQIFYRAGKRGLGGGLPGALAGIIQVLSLMWLRTIINYQCRYGTNFSQALHTLLQEGGIARLYRGLSFAIVQAPLSRFVSTAANDGIESLLASLSWTKNWGPGRTTVVASIVVGIWRTMLMRKLH